MSRSKGDAPEQTVDFDAMFAQSPVITVMDEDDDLYGNDISDEDIDLEGLDISEGNPFND